MLRVLMELPRLRLAARLCAIKAARSPAMRLWPIAFPSASSLSIAVDCTPEHQRSQPCSWAA